MEYKQAGEILEQNVSSLQNTLDERLNDHNLILSKLKLDQRRKVEEFTLKIGQLEKDLASNIVFFFVGFFCRSSLWVQDILGL